MKTIYAGQAQAIDLGRQGENLARKIVFTDPAAWREDYGDGVVQMIAQRSGEATVYPVALDMDGDAAVWHVTAADTALSGYGRCELRYMVNDVVVKSQNYLTLVAQALTGTQTAPPEPQQGWVDKVLQAGTDAVNAAQRAEEAVGNAAWVDAEVDESGHLILACSDNFNGAEFALNENGHLEVMYR